MRALALLFTLSPAMLLAQKHDELVSIQRDVAQLEDNVKQLQKTLDEKMAALMALTQQAVDASARNAAALEKLRGEMDQKLADQQSKVVAPVATLSMKLEDMSGDFARVRENVAELVRKTNDLDTKVSDISVTVRSIAAASAPAAPPPSADPNAPPAKPAPPAGMTAELSFQQAYRDFSANKDDLALDEFAKFLQYFSDTEKGPDAQYYIGAIYYRAQDWPNAVKAFDAVLERFPKNPKTPDAQYYKAFSLMKQPDKKNDAITEFKNLLRDYPQSTWTQKVHVHLRELGAERPSGTHKK